MIKKTGLSQTASIPLLLVAALFLSLAGACGGNGDGQAPRPSSTSVPSTTQSTPTTSRPVPVPQRRAAGTTATTAATSAGSVRVSLYARAGEIPPGQTHPVEAPAWRAVGTGWPAGNVNVIVKRAGGEGAVLDLGQLPVVGGRWEQTFVLPKESPPGQYVVVASQGRRQAQAGFALG